MDYFLWLIIQCKIKLAVTDAITVTAKFNNEDIGDSAALEKTTSDYSKMVFLIGQFVVNLIINI